MTENFRVLTGFMCSTLKSSIKPDFEIFSPLGVHGAFHMLTLKLCLSLHADRNSLTLHSELWIGLSETIGSLSIPSN